MTLSLLIKRLDAMLTIRGDVRVCIIRAHEGGGVSHHEIQGPDTLYGFDGLCFSMGEQIRDGAELAGEKEDK